MDAPEFSIVVPTRNRSEQLAACLVPLLAQSHLDCEIVVSDNSDDDHADRNAALIARLNGPIPLRRVRPPRLLNMVDHWNFALSQAKGKYVGVVTDRMTLLPSTIRDVRPYLAAGARCVSFSSTSLARKDGRLFVRPLPEEDRVEETSTEDILQIFARGGLTKACPRLLNCFVERTVLARMEHEAGRSLLGISPDYSFLFNYLGRYPTYRHLHKAYLVDHAPDVSNGMAILSGRTNAATGDFNARLMNEQSDVLKLRPMPQAAHFFTNVILSEYLLAARSIPGAKFPPLDMAGIYASCWKHAKARFVAGNPDTDHSLDLLEQFRQANGLARPSLLDRLHMAYRKQRNLKKRLRQAKSAATTRSELTNDIDADIRHGQEVADLLKMHGSEKVEPLLRA